MPQYPIELARANSRGQFSHRNEHGQIRDHFEWAISYPAADSNVFQLTINRKDSDENLFYRNLGLEWLFLDQGNPTRGYFYDENGDNQQFVSLASPGSNDLRFIIMVWLHSDAGGYRHETDLETCDNCNQLDIWCENEHLTCTRCNELQAAKETQEYSIQMNYSHYEDFWLCRDCEDVGYDLSDITDARLCQDCEQWCGEDYAFEYDIISEVSRMICQGCVGSYYFCEQCERYGDPEVFVEDGGGDYNYCEHCANGNGSRLINAWDFRPPFIFFPPLPEDPFKPIYIGIEFELNWPGYNPDAHEWIEGLDQFDELLYAKHDSSIDEGFEVCSMPMSPDWALENLPFDYFQVAINLGACSSHLSTGMHIHIDRTAFTTAQMWKFLQIHRKLDKLCGMAGGRGTNTEYAKFNQDDNSHLEESMMFIARTKGQAFDNPRRYVAVNLKNENTIELRYMEGGIKPDNIKKNIEWVKALYEFTDYISVADVKAGVLDDYSFLLGWILDEKKYPVLAPFAKANVWVTQSMPERTVV